MSIPPIFRFHSLSVQDPFYSVFLFCSIPVPFLLRSVPSPFHSAPFPFHSARSQFRYVPSPFRLKPFYFLSVSLFRCSSFSVPRSVGISLVCFVSVSYLIISSFISFRFRLGSFLFCFLFAFGFVLVWFFSVTVPFQMFRIKFRSFRFRLSSGSIPFRFRIPSISSSFHICFVPLPFHSLSDSFRQVFSVPSTFREVPLRCSFPSFSLFSSILCSASISLGVFLLDSVSFISVWM